MRRQNSSYSKISVRILFLLSFYLFTFLPLSAQIGTWRAYMAYHDIQQIQKVGDELFVMASNSLYQYNLNDESIYTYDKTNGLNDTYITLIKWCPKGDALIVVYQNSNIDLVKTNGDVMNISDIYNKVITGDKTIHQITIDGQYAYLACSFGIVKLNVSSREISESYILNKDILATVIENGVLYAKSTDEVIQGLLSSNLIDPNNWTTATNPPSFEEDTKDYNTYIETVKRLSPDGPKYNHFYNMFMHKGKLYTVGGGWYQLDNYKRPGTVQILDEQKEWTIYQDDIKPAFASYYRDVNSLAIDPRDENHVIVASCSGLYEFQNGKFLKNYTAGNTNYFESAARNNSPNYVRTDGILYDKDGNLYCLNSSSSTPIIKKAVTGEWSGIMHQSLRYGDKKSLPGLKGSILDSRGLIWFCNDNSNSPALLCFNPENENVVRFNNFVNQDGTNINVSYVRCVCEDRNGNIWIGTNQGPLYLGKEEMENNSLGFQQYKVPRNDGTNYADYLLASVDITCMAIDGAGRKWFGTSSNGVYLISSNNNEQLQHFTVSNSKLLSDNIESIAIHPKTGEVFFGTYNGLCSYISDATEPVERMSDDTVYAYPNPVNLNDYSGLITITGLSYDADVKITSSSGHLIAEGKSNGGLFTWDGKDKNGQTVAAGVYMVVTATNEGNKGTVCKIAIIK